MNVEDFNVDILSKNIKISTITLDCKIELKKKEIKQIIELDLKKFENEEILNKFKEIIFIKNRSMLILNNETKEFLKKINNKNITKSEKYYYKKINKKLKSKLFSNQTSLLIKINNNNTYIKIFKNGTIHLTGFNNLETLKKIMEILKELIRYVFKIDIIIKDYKIRLINSSINIHYKINRTKLYKELLDKKINVHYNPNRYAGVNVKINLNDNKTTFLIFHTGMMLILASGGFKHLELSYKYIVNLLDNLKSKIICKKIE